MEWKTNFIIGKSKKKLPVLLNIPLFCENTFYCFLVEVQLWILCIILRYRIFSHILRETWFVWFTTSEATVFLWEDLFGHFSVFSGHFVRDDKILLFQLSFPLFLDKKYNLLCTVIPKQLVAIYICLWFVIWILLFWDSFIFGVLNL